MRRGKPEALVAVLIVALLAAYGWYTQSLVTTLRADGARSTDMYRAVFRAMGDTSSEATPGALFALAKDIRGQGVPLIQIDRNGVIGGHANLPFDKDNSLPDADHRPARGHDLLRRLQRDSRAPAHGDFPAGERRDSAPGWSLHHSHARRRRA
jgi:hypothetical protein